MTSAPAPDAPITIGQARDYLSAGLTVFQRRRQLDHLPLFSLSLLSADRKGLLRVGLHPPQTPTATHLYTPVSTQLRPEQVLQFAIIHGVHVNAVH
ncbi:hypothetical protein [Deinococcus kurensis]|uniref:hypothetical protein n=1 Tax=Deinococcus kurensis TaxID=2662757 RepID=UPI0012D30CC6|nr:hypothetical protein [Deinococcus kurensis]